MTSLSRAGVSIATVSRVLHGQDAVRETTRARVRAAIDELGYVPDGAAQSLARSRKDVIGLVCVEHTGLKPDQYDIESMSLLFYDEVMRGVEARIRELSWSLLITFLREDENSGATLPQDGPVHSRLTALSGKVDGLLIGEGVVPPAVLARLAKRVPVVVVAGDTAQRGVDVVSADNWSGAHALVEHLVTVHGRRRLFHVDGPATAPDATARRLAMQAVIEAHPGTVLTGSYNGRFTVHSGQDAAERLLTCTRGAGEPLPDAIVCANDQMAIGMVRTLTRARRQGPRGRGDRRLRRHLPGQPHRPAADHGAPADAQDRRARLRPAARADRRPVAAAEDRAAPVRAGAPVELRLPAGHRDEAAGGDYNS